MENTAKNIQENDSASDEFGNLILAYSLLNESVKKAKLLDIIKQNLDIFEQILKGNHKDINYENKDILESLDLSENDDFLIYVYMLELYINDYLNLLKKEKV